jgi:hypothetical protein
MSSHRSCCPPEVRSNAGLSSSLGGVRRHSFPRVTARIGPSDSRFAFGPSSGLPRFRPSAPNRAHGYPRFLGHLLRTCRAPRPRQGRRPSCHDTGTALAAFGDYANTLGFLGSYQFSRLTSHGPLARAPTHRRTRCRPASYPPPSFVRRKARYRSAWLALIGWDSHPRDDSPYFYEGIRTSLSYGPAFPGRTGALVFKPSDGRARILADVAGRGHKYPRRIGVQTIQERPTPKRENGPTLPSSRLFRPAS